MMSISFKRTMFQVFLPLFIGLLIYVVTRTDSWLNQIVTQGDAYDTVNNPIGLPGNWFTDVIIDNSPDFCWSYSITSSLIFWRHFSGGVSRLFFLFIFLLILFQEFIQVLFPLYFTFDMLDICAAIIAFSLSIRSNRKYV